MALPTTTTNATIPGRWSPASSCQNSSDNWKWLDGLWGMGVFGSPDQTSSCYPPDFTPTLGLLYTASTCPDGFTPACTTNYYSSSWSTLCCPQATGDVSYKCNYKSFWSWTAACITSISPYTTTRTVTVTSFGDSVRSTDASFVAFGYSVLDGSLAASTVLTTTGIFSYEKTYIPDQYLWAFAIPITPLTSSASAGSTTSSALISSTSPSNLIFGTNSSLGTSSIPSTSSTPPSATGGSTTGLSAGASAGIAIGALVAAIFIALGTWSFYRRATNKRRGGGGGGGGEEETDDAAGRPVSAEAQEQQQLELPAGWRDEEHAPRRSPVEMHDVDFRQYELGDTRRYPELP